MEPLSIPARRPPKRLLFDRRYGWVVDEWKDPSEEALASGRGMFCILPITKSLLNLAAHLVKTMTTSAVRVLRNPNEFSPQMLCTNLSIQCSRLIHFVQKPNLKLLTFCMDAPEQPR